MKCATVAVTFLILILGFRAQSDEKKLLTFDITVMGEMVDQAATAAGFRTLLFPREVHLGFKNLDASDGEKLFIYHGEFKSADEATRYFDWNIRRRAARAIKQGQKTNRDGNIVGRRAQFLGKSPGKTETWVVMWTEEAYFYAVHAPTLECALEVERLSQH
jgi:hypothetical protein